MKITSKCVMSVQGGKKMKKNNVYPLEYNGYSLVKVYPHMALYRHSKGWYECFKPYDVGMIQSVDTTWVKWK